MWAIELSAPKNQIASPHPPFFAHTCNKNGLTLFGPTNNTYTWEAPHPTLVPARKSLVEWNDMNEIPPQYLLGHVVCTLQVDSFHNLFWRMKYIDL